ncbi:MAG: Phosphate-specific transport system accessory protein PhoU [Acidimicrobiales bacterium]|nr:MAG: phosphate signaling complex protein PhoU [Actinomycetota bacterium]MBV6509667.1 Phosphate-specific transport system accessory protein PhoU [Acidimicrobiales bacterium]RIK06357.1 MAG: phosphate transport system regulatory protein PhoU [Acidobacteriota bacterium]
MAEEHRIEFHEAMDEIRSRVVRLGAIATEVIPRGTEALLGMDLRLAQRIIDDDDTVDELSLDIEERAYNLLALQQPMARDLRFLITSIHLTSELERTADLVVNVCKGARRIYRCKFDPRIRGLIKAMSDEATELTKHAMDAYVEADESLASALDDIDDRLDELHTDYIEAVFDSHSAGNLDLQAAVQLALIGRYYERIGDHAVNVGERITYMVTGWLPEHTGVARVALKNRYRSSGVNDRQPASGSQGTQPEERREE